MATTMIHPRATELLTAPRMSATRPVRWLRIATGALLTTALIIGLMALAGRALPPPNPDWAAPGGFVELADE
jgi:ADP-ribose pyrophosphatase YjhB (NUDIX family)